LASSRYECLGCLAQYVVAADDMRRNACQSARFYTTPMLRRGASRFCARLRLPDQQRLSTTSAHLFDRAQSSAMAVGKKFVSAVRCKPKPGPSQTLSQTDFEPLMGRRALRSRLDGSGEVEGKQKRIGQKGRRIRILVCHSAHVR
jgi:hypothetical protein